jgi:alkylation response protein AidB-like acyl-CoA dehydrogenase
MRRAIFEPEHEQFRETVREYIAREVAPHSAKWEAAGIVDRSAYAAAGKHGVIGYNVPEKFGGGGVDDFRFSAVVAEELGRYGAAAPALTLQNIVLAPYLISLGTDEQKRRWLPGFARGELIAAIAMSEPGAGSDLAGIRTSGVRDGDDWIVTGQKTFISSGINADLVIVVTRTDPEAGHRGFTLLVVERDMPGFARGRKLEKMGQRSADTAELFFDQVRVPPSNVLGEVGRGFYHLMHNLPSERMSIAINAVAGAREIFGQTLEYARNRHAFGQPIGSFQYNRFRFAEMETELDIAQAYIDKCVRAIVDGELTAVDAAKAKWWVTELQKRVVDTCLQLHGGYGYMTEYAVSRAYTDSRVQTIYGGSTEIMKDIVGKSLGL